MHITTYREGSVPVFAEASGATRSSSRMGEGSRADNSVSPPTSTVLAPVAPSQFLGPFNDNQLGKWADTLNSKLRPAVMIAPQRLAAHGLARAIVTSPMFISPLKNCSCADSRWDLKGALQISVARQHWPAETARRPDLTQATS